MFPCAYWIFTRDRNRKQAMEEARVTYDAMLNAYARVGHELVRRPIASPCWQNEIRRPLASPP